MQFRFPASEYCTRYGLEKIWNIQLERAGTSLPLGLNFAFDYTDPIDFVHRTLIRTLSDHSSRINSLHYTTTFSQTSTFYLLHILDLKPTDLDWNWMIPYRFKEHPWSSLPPTSPNTPLLKFLTHVDVTSLSDRGENMTFTLLYSLPFYRTLHI